MALTKDGAVVNRILTAVGCVTISQVCALFPDKSDKAIRYILSRLYHIYNTFCNQNADHMKK